MAERVARGDLSDDTYFAVIDRRARMLVEDEARRPRLLRWWRRTRNVPATRVQRGDHHPAG
ncbi:hypothetical protein [Actinomadura macra]|uniref:hypothetical protein n=1 Tax=Actinomadura macra TaxID=46164 RepID=UPI00082CF6E7|nr:hypothetical protein [Actinomadura macra]